MAIYGHSVLINLASPPLDMLPHALRWLPLRRSQA
jgi:hypothetical protein